MAPKAPFAPVEWSDNQVKLNGILAKFHHRRNWPNLPVFTANLGIGCDFSSKSTKMVDFELAKLRV